MIRATGRLRNEASPSRTEKKGRPASIARAEPKTRPGVAAVEHALGFVQAVGARRDDPVIHVEPVFADPLHARPEGGHDARRGLDVAAVSGAR